MIITFYQLLALGAMLGAAYLDKPIEPFLAAVLIIGALHGVGRKP